MLGVNDIFCGPFSEEINRFPIPCLYAIERWVSTERDMYIIFNEFHP